MIRKVGELMKRRKFAAIPGTVFTDDGIRKDDSVDEALEQYSKVIAYGVNYDVPARVSPGGQWHD